jgi:hypothetical protein
MALLATLVANADGARANVAHDVLVTARTASGSLDADLRTAARAWTDAFLTGTVKEIRALQGPACKSRRTSSLSEQKDYIRRLRAAMRRALGVALDDIHIVDVQRDRPRPQGLGA